MRVEVVKQVMVMWQTLKDKKGNFIPNLIGPFLSLTLIKSKGLLRALSPPLLFILNLTDCLLGISQL